MCYSVNLSEFDSVVFEENMFIWRGRGGELFVYLNNLGHNLLDKLLDKKVRAHTIHDTLPIDINFHIKINVS